MIERISCSNKKLYQCVNYSEFTGNVTNCVIINKNNIEPCFIARKDNIIVPNLNNALIINNPVSIWEVLKGLWEWRNIVKKHH